MFGVLSGRAVDPWTRVPRVVRVAVTYVVAAAIFFAIQWWLREPGDHPLRATAVWIGLMVAIDAVWGITRVVRRRRRR